MIDGRKSDDENLPTIENFEGIGDLVVGGSAPSGDTQKILFIALAMLNDPLINFYFLSQKLKLADRMTKTKIFPREGMALPDSETYSAPQEEVVELPEAQENA